MGGTSAGGGGAWRALFATPGQPGLCASSGSKICAWGWSQNGSEDVPLGGCALWSLHKAEQSSLSKLNPEAVIQAGGRGSPSSGGECLSLADAGESRGQKTPEVLTLQSFLGWITSRK